MSERGRDGKYADDLSKPCAVCGERKGAHDAEEPHAAQDGSHDYEPGRGSR
jgi:hypothetical protein